MHLNYNHDGGSWQNDCNDYNDVYGSLVPSAESRKKRVSAMDFGVGRLAWQQE
jgi:hypothetical protein